jgi:ubiquinone/menaquinone biosynthesis C-methylase UbiE
MLKKLIYFNVTERDAFVQNFANSLPPGSKVLDAGAGSCPYRNFFSHCQYITQDFAQLQSQQLRSGNGYGIIDVISDITAIPLEDNTFDFIICTEVFEHIPNPDLAVKEFSRLLKKEGKLLITAPLMSGLHQEPYHYYGGFTPYWYDYFFNKYGIKTLKIVPNRGFFYFLAQENLRAIRMLKNKFHLFFFILIPFVFLYSLMAAISFLFGSLIKDSSFTVGYHVIGTKN